MLITYEDGWAPEMVWTLDKGKKSFAFVGNNSSIVQSVEQSL